MATPDLVALADQWLAEKGCTLWWDWDITEPDERLEAAQEFVKAYREFANVVLETYAELSRPKPDLWHEFVNWDVEAIVRPSSACVGFPPPTIDQHEIALMDRGEIDYWGRSHGFLPGMGPDEVWDEAMCLYMQSQEGEVA